MTTQDKVIEGVIKNITFKNQENGYTVFQLETARAIDPITVVGKAPDAHVGSYIVAQGTFEEHEKFGKQLKARSIISTVPSNKDQLIKYLSSGIVKGIGKKTAKNIVDAFEENTKDILSTDVEAVSKIQGVGNKKALELMEHFQKESARDGLTRFLQQYDIPVSLAKKIYDRYRKDSLKKLSENPYLLAQDLKGVGFTTADTIAMKLGLSPSSPQRVAGALLYALEKSSEDGHCYLTKKLLFEKMQSLIGGENTENSHDQLSQLIRQGKIKETRSHYALPHLCIAEQFVAHWIHSQLRIEKSDTTFVDERSIELAENNLGVTFSSEQRMSISLAQNNQFLLLTGGPGCGKTTVIRGLLTVFKNQGKEILLAAPTGRAAQRMSSVCNYPASTIHRLLKFDPLSGNFIHGMSNPLSADVIIIDESSMIDVLLAKDLFSAIPSSTKVIMVGDKDQLPSVGPGRVFGDLLSLKEIPAIELSKVFRRSESSSINKIAMSINRGEIPDIPSPDGVTKTNAYFLQAQTPEDASKLVEKLVAEQLPKKFGYTLDDIVVLTPTNRGPLGTQSLNEKLQSRFTVENTQQELELFDFRFRVNDRVCQRVNNYNIDPQGVFNGDTGKVYALDKTRKRLVVELWDGRFITYERESLPELMLAYAITVHRAQGSESKCVVLALHDSHYTLLERQLLYTAVTRAKELLIIVGSKRALKMACQRNQSGKRLTQLPDLIREIISE